PAGDEPCLAADPRTRHSQDRQADGAADERGVPGTAAALNRTRRVLAGRAVSAASSPYLAEETRGSKRSAPGPARTMRERNGLDTGPFSRLREKVPGGRMRARERSEALFLTSIRMVGRAGAARCARALIRRYAPPS